MLEVIRGLRKIAKFSEEFFEHAARVHIGIQSKPRMLLW